MRFFGVDKDLFKYTRNGKPVLQLAIPTTYVWIAFSFADTTGQSRWFDLRTTAEKYAS